MFYFNEISRICEFSRQQYLMAITLTSHLLSQHHPHKLEALQILNTYKISPTLFLLSYLDLRSYHYLDIEETDGFILLSELWLEQRTSLHHLDVQLQKGCFGFVSVCFSCAGFQCEAMPMQIRRKATKS